MNTQRMTKNILASAVLVATAVTSINVMALNSTATVTVKNAIDIAEVTPLHIGTIRASADLTAASVKVATLVVNPETGVGVATNDTATIGQLAVGTAGEFEVTGLAPYQPLDITSPAATTLKLSPHPTGGAFFHVNTFTFWVTSITTPALYATSGDLKADATGVATFSVGATVTTSDVAADATDTQYQDTDYTGTYIIDITYP